MADSDTRTIAIGLDGAHFGLLEPWIAVDRLANIEWVKETRISNDVEYLDM